MANKQTKTIIKLSWRKVNNYADIIIRAWGAPYIINLVRIGGVEFLAPL